MPLAGQQDVMTPPPTQKSAVPPTSPPPGAAPPAAATGAQPAQAAKTTSVTNLAIPPVNTKIDVPLPADVLAILEANKNFYLTPCTLPPCLKKSKETTSKDVGRQYITAHLDLPQVPFTEAMIPYDPSPKPLKVTPKRVGS
ncbi:unnamed protein product [Strongylus vulgaris]|uniref:Uncharacterized protein n=1 Tax=Strongylus vulgaris TaxID=40348 RepID=A0A3P7K8S1_STRVU|nr:unnamed protein product [Strongylus vulgaris]